MSTASFVHDQFPFRTQRNHAVVVRMSSRKSNLESSKIAHMLRSDVRLGKDPSPGAGLFDR